MGSHNTKEKSKQQSTMPEQYKLRKRREVDLTVISARVDKVNITGIKRTHDDYLQRVAENLFKAKTFQDVIMEAYNTRAYLNDLGIFKDLHVHIDISRGKNASPNGYDVTFDGVELSRISGAFGTEVGKNEGLLTTELATPNIWGRGERLSLQGSYSNLKTTDITFKLSKPFYHTKFGDNRPEISLGVFRNSSAMQASAYKIQNTGLLADFSFLLPLTVSHSLQYEMGFREIFTLGKTSPFFVRENCGPRMISLIRHICSYDQRDNTVLPTQGFFIRTVNEFSGFGGNIGYMMNQTHAEINIPLFAGISTQISSRIGIIQLDNKSPNIPLGSLFTIGGPLTLRGFKYGGAGPHIDGYASGAHSYWLTGLHLWAPLPFSTYLGRFASNFRTHFFYNFGNCNSFSTDKMRSAAGLGLALRIGERARIEFNYCYPIEKQPGDLSNRGFQFGFGYKFI